MSETERYLFHENRTANSKEITFFFYDLLKSCYLAVTRTWDCAVDMYFTLWNICGLAKWDMGAYIDYTDYYPAPVWSLFKYFFSVWHHLEQLLLSFRSLYFSSFTNYSGYNCYEIYLTVAGMWVTAKNKFRLNHWIMLKLKTEFLCYRFLSFFLYFFLHFSFFFLFFLLFIFSFFFF